jgi:hypothetical protein
MKQIRHINFSLTIFALAGLALSASAQTASVFTNGLTTPNRIIVAGSNSLIVTEAGTRTANTGRVSLINRETGARQTLLGGLPSAVSFLGNPAGDPDGPSGLLLAGHTLYVTIGIGDRIVRGPGPGQERINPNPPSSPIFDSILALTLPEDYETTASEFTLALADQVTLASGGDVVLTNADGQTMTIRVVADLPDYRLAPLPPPNENNVKASHLYGIEMFQRNLYAPDAGLNQIYQVNLKSGDFSVFTTFPDRPNPLFPTVGRPTIEAVPDNIHRFGNRLLVPLLTGTPFIPGMSEVRSVDARSGEDYGLISNLTSAIDILRVETLTSKYFGGAFNPGDNSSYYTLEFSTNQRFGAPGRLRFYSDADAAPIDVFSNLVTPTSMASDEDSGNIFITNIVPGTVTKVSFP